MKARASFL